MSADAGAVDAGAVDAGPADGCLTSTSPAFARPFAVDDRDYPFRSCAFQTDVGRLHYVDEGPRDAAETVVMVHGNPTWSFLYRNIAKAMIEDGHRVILMDHIGLGMSDIPLTTAFDYRPRSHADHLEALVTALDLQNVTLVVQDWGGPIGLGMATRQPNRISRLLIMNTWAWSVDIDDPGTAHRLVDWYEQVQLMSAFSPTAFCDFAFAGQSELNAAEADPTRGELYDRVLAAYLSPAIDPSSGAYRTSEPCAPMQIFAESIFDDNAFQGEVEAQLPSLVGKPYALLFGLSDPLFGALRCDVGLEAPCPGTATCACDEELLPARVAGGCDDPAADEFHVCLLADGSAIDPFADRFVDILGPQALVRRDAVVGADHMVQEWAPDQVIEVLRALMSQAAAGQGG